MSGAIDCAMAIGVARDAEGECFLLQYIVVELVVDCTP